MQRDWHLGETDFFHGLSDEKAAFMALAKRRQVKKNEIIFFEEDDSSSCFYLETGLIKIFRIAPSGKEPIFFLRRKGEMFGLAEVTDSVVRKANAQALTPCVLYEIGRDDFERFLSRNFRAARNVIRILGRRLRYLGEQIGNLMVCDVGTRLIKLLVYVAYDQLGDETAWCRPVTIPVRLTQEQMAAMIGSCQQTVSDLLTQLQKEEFISITRREITILNPLKLLHNIEQ